MSDPTNTSILDQVHAAIDEAAKMPTLGYVVTWRLRKVVTTLDALSEALKESGFDKHMPPAPSPRVVMRRALESYVKSVLGATRSNSMGAINRMIRVANPPGAKHVVYSVVNEEIDWEALGFGYDTGFRVLMDKKTGMDIVCTPTVDGQILAEMQDPLIMEALRPHLDEARVTVKTGDLGDLVGGILRGELNALPLRYEGGAYVVPAADKERLDALQKLVNGLSDASMLVALPIVDIANARPQMAQAVHAALGDEIDAWARDLEEFAGKEPGTVRENTVKRRLKIFAEVRRRAAAYSDVLGGRMAEILTRVDHLENAAKSLRETLPETIPNKGNEPDEDEPLPLPLFRDLDEQTTALEEEEEPEEA